MSWFFFSSSSTCFSHSQINHTFCHCLLYSPSFLSQIFFFVRWKKLFVFLGPVQKQVLWNQRWRGSLPTRCLRMGRILSTPSDFPISYLKFSSALCIAETFSPRCCNLISSNLPAKLIILVLCHEGHWMTCINKIEIFSGDPSTVSANGVMESTFRPPHHLGMNVRKDDGDGDIMGNILFWQIILSQKNINITSSLFFLTQRSFGLKLTPWPGVFVLPVKHAQKWWWGRRGHDGEEPNPPHHSDPPGMKGMLAVKASRRRPWLVRVVSSLATFFQWPREAQGAVTSWIGKLGKKYLLRETNNTCWPGILSI